MAAHKKRQSFVGDSLTEGQESYNAFIELLDQLNPANNNIHHSANMDQGVYDSLCALAEKYYQIETTQDAINTADGDAIVMWYFLAYLQQLQGLIIPSHKARGVGGDDKQAQTTLDNSYSKLLDACLKNIETQLLLLDPKAENPPKTPIHPALAAIIGGIVGAVIGAVVFGGLGLLMSLPIGGAGVFFGAFTGAIKGWSIGASVAIPLFSGLAGATMFGGSAHKKRKAIEASLNEASGLYQFAKQTFSP